MAKQTAIPRVFLSYYQLRNGLRPMPKPGLFQRINWPAILIFLGMMAFWAFVFWAGTRLWK